MKSSTEIRATLRDAYDQRVRERELRPAPPWETIERDGFAGLLQRQGKAALLEVGAATGTDGEFFRNQGFEVVCIDLSPQMVERCKAKNLTAQVMDVAALEFPPDSFDAVYAMNCLVHVPRSELSGVLEQLSRVIRPDGLFYLGQYGGRRLEGVWEDDSFEPKRFFSHLTDEELHSCITQFFALESFQCIPHGWSGLHFQSLIVRKPSPSSKRTDRSAG